MKRKRDNRIQIYLIGGFVLFGLGLTIGKLTDFGYFILSKDISIIEALSFFATFGLAIYIVKVLEKEIQDNRNEKDLLLKRAEEIRNKIDDCLDTISADAIPFFKVTHGIQRLKLSIKYVLAAIAKFDIKDFDCELISSYADDIKSLRILLTSTPIVKDEDQIISPDIVVENNLIRLSPSRQITVEAKLEELKNKVFMLQIEINRF